MPKKVLFISHDGLTDPLGQSQILPYLKGLAGADYHFTILSCEKPINFEKNKQEISTSLINFTIKWVPIYYHKRPPVIATLYDVWQLRRKAKSLHRKEHFDLVHTRPGVAALIGLWLKKEYGVKFLNDIREFYADSRVDGNMWNKNNFLYKKIYNFFLKKEKQAVALNDGIVCLTHAAEKIIRQWPEYNENVPLTVIPCSVDVNLFDPKKITKTKKLNFENTLNIEDTDFIISYLGSIGSWYLIDEMVRFFKVICDKIPASKFLFISPDEHELVAQRAHKYGLSPDRIIVTRAARNEIPTLLSFSRFSVFFIKPCYSKQSSSPTKHGEIMAMGIPVITNEGVGDVASIVEKYHSGIVLNEMNDKEFISALNKIEEASFDYHKIRDGAIEYYSLDKAIEKYRKIYKEIIG